MAADEPTYTLTDEVYLDAARSKVVDRDSDEAAVRLGGPGKVIPAEQAKALNLGQRHVAKPSKPAETPAVVPDPAPAE